MLQTVREYAQARLAETGELDLVQRRHLAYFLSVAPPARPGLHGSGQAELLDDLERPTRISAPPSISLTPAARRPQCLADGLRLAAALRLLWQQRGPLAEGVLHLDRLLACDDAQQRRVTPPSGPPRCWPPARWPVSRAVTRATDLARQSIELCSVRDDHRPAMAHRFLGEAALAVGADNEAEPYFERQLAEASQAQDPLGQADACNILGQAPVTAVSSVVPGRCCGRR